MGRERIEAGAGILEAEAVLACAEVEPTMRFFVEQLGFRLETIFPADDPSVAVVSGHGLRLRLQRGPGSPGVLRLRCREARELANGAMALQAPNGARIELVETDTPLVVPPLQPGLVVTRLRDGASWVSGRAGMRYRDLIPGRLGGRFVASHIQIPDGGPVPDYVHFHEVRFQVIFCHRGWVRVVYEDQGPPFVLREGDCVLQPPRIRHRVLESSAGLEVVEIGCPAEHETRVDHELDLPTQNVHPNRAFGGQRFVRHEAATARWIPWRANGFVATDTGIGAATGGLGGVQVVRASGATSSPPLVHDAELHFVFVRRGTATFVCETAADHALREGDAIVVPAGLRHALRDCSADLELLEVTLPANLTPT